MDIANRQRSAERGMIKAWVNWKDCLILKRRELSLLESQADRSSQEENIAWFTSGIARIVGTFVSVGGFLAPFVKPDAVLTLVLTGAAITITGAFSTLAATFSHRTKENTILEETKKYVQKEGDDLEDMIVKSDNFEKILDVLRSFKNERNPPLSDILMHKFRCERKNFVMVDASGMTVHTALAVLFLIANCTERTGYIRDVIGGNKVLCIAIFAVLFDLYMMVKRSCALYKDKKSPAGKAIHEVLDKLSSSETEKIIQYIDELIYSMSRNNDTGR